MLNGAENMYADENYQVVCVDFSPSFLKNIISPKNAAVLLDVYSDFIESIVFKHYKFRSGDSDYDDALNAGKMGFFQSLMCYTPDSGPIREFAEPFIRNTVLSYKKVHFPDNGYGSSDG